MVRKAKNIYHLFQSVAANTLYQFPAKNLIVIGVTGTDGKTTTANMIYHILKETGHKAALISTVGAVIGEKKYDIGFHVTTPSSFSLLKYIQMAKEAGCTHVVLEVTSHGLDQNRVFGIPFEVSVLTNITHEHLDYHKTYKRYVAAKLKLLAHSKKAIANLDDESFKLIKEGLGEKHVITYSLQSNSADYYIGNMLISPSYASDLNGYNLLAASAVAHTLGIPSKDIVEAMKSFVLPKGRQEIVYKKDFTIMIDFAHTPNSFARILQSTKQLTKGKLIHIFGSAGKRDASKRPLMGKVSSVLSDVIILTAEDPRGESVESISKEVAKGFEKGFKEEGKDSKRFFSKNTFAIIPDRKEAIFEAVKHAQKGDYILITGKSHEKSMNYGKGEEAWDEYEVVQKALEQRNNEKH